MTTQDTSWPLIARCVGYAIAVFAIATLVATIFSPVLPDQRWAILDEDTLHAAWNPDTQKVQVSVSIQKRENCQRVIVEESLRPITDNDLGAMAIPLDGFLADKIQRVASGSSATVFDEATPRRQVEPGHYLLVLSAFCELPQDPDEQHQTQTVVPVTPTTVRTLPVQVVLVVAGLEDSIARHRVPTTARYMERK